MPGYSVELSQHLQSVWDPRETLVELMDESAAALGVFWDCLLGVLALSTLLDREVEHWTHGVATGSGDARARTSRPDSRRVLNLGTRHFHMASRFQVAQLGVRKQKADWGRLPLLFHYVPPDRHACTTLPCGVPVLTAKALLCACGSSLS